MSKALENAFAKIDAMVAFHATLDQRCEADAIYSNAKRIAEENKPNAVSFDTLVANVTGGRRERRNDAIRTMHKRRVQISIEMQSNKAEAA